VYNNDSKLYTVANKLDSPQYNLIDKSFEQNDAFWRMIQIGSLCSTASIENISIVDKIEVPLEGNNVSVNCD